MTSRLVVWAALVLSATSATAETYTASQPYQAKKSNPVTYDVDFSVVVTAPYRTKVLRVWLPMPQTDTSQQVHEGTLNSFPMEVEPAIGVEPLYGNKFAYFEFHEPKGAQIIRHTFRVTAWQLNWEIKPDQVEKVTEWPAEFVPYLRSETQAVAFDDRFHDLLRNLIPRSRGQLADLGAAMAWVDQHMAYDHTRASLQANSIRAFETRVGHCSDYHGLCAAFGRAMGYPTRVTYGINPFPKNSPSHCKLEAFIPPYGWVSFDVSETQKLIGEIQRAEELSVERKERLCDLARARLLSGFRDNTWFLQTKGTDYDLAPQAAKRVAVVRTAYVEADGIALPEPDPGAAGETRFAWMTVHRYLPDKEVESPFVDWTSLEPAE